MRKVWVWILALLCLTMSASATQLPAIPGMEAPDFEVTLIDGETFKLSEQRGKVVLLNIWATWCGPCVAEMPEIEQLSQDYAEDLVVIGVNCGEKEADVAAFVEEKGYTYRFAADEDYLISASLYPTNSIPYTVIIDANGVITQMHLGGGVGMYDVLEGYVLEAMENAANAEVEILA